MKKINIVGFIVLSSCLSSCALVKTPGTSRDKNLKKIKAVVTKGSEGLAGQLTKAGTCDRGVFVIDAVHDTSALDEAKGTYYAWGKGYFTSKPWANASVNPFHVVGFEKGESTFPNREAVKTVEIPFLSDFGQVTASFYTGTTQTSNRIEEGDPDKQAEALNLLPIIKGDKNSTYQLVMKNGEKKRTKNYYMGNLPRKVASIPGLGEKNTEGRSVKSPGSIFGVGDLTHFSFGKPGLGFGVYMVPADIEDPKASFNRVFKVAAGDKVKLTLAQRDKELPEGAKDARIEVQIFHADPKDKLAPLLFNVTDSGQTAVEVPTEGLAKGEYWMITKRSHLYSSPVQDEEGGNFCVLAGAVATSKLSVAEKKADA